MSRYYSITTYDHGRRASFCDSYTGLGMAKSEARKIVGERGPCCHAIIAQELPRPAGHAFGARWEPVSLCRHDECGQIQFEPPAAAAH